jgi:uncharacterized protein (DUF736 family)
MHRDVPHCVVRGGRDYLSLKLDDPSFTAPILASLFDDPNDKDHLLRCRETGSQKV